MDIRQKDLDRVRAILRHYLRGKVAVLAYGSRVVGTSHDGSDLDLLIDDRESAVSTVLLARLRESFEESHIPIMVDLNLLSRMPSSFDPDQLQVEKIEF